MMRNLHELYLLMDEEALHIQPLEEPLLHSDQKIPELRTEPPIQDIREHVEDKSAISSLDAGAAKEEPKWYDNTSTQGRMEGSSDPSWAV
mmetsp:Transcript_36094/g.52919  ORF Transcript_36094/g.52919 Transcript_36094/m.52919 type:complete len:90 (+) Transcript_36094:578-847(+)